MEVTKNGDFIFWTIEITNLGPVANVGVKVQDYKPLGLAYQSYTIGPPVKGTFNILSGLWDVGTHNVGQIYTLTIQYVVTDITQVIAESGIFGFPLLAIISGDNIDPNNVNNTITAFVELTSCPPSAGAINDLNACLCGSVAANDTPCSHGTTEYIITLGSLVNLDPLFTINIVTGEYNAMGMILNPYLPASFTYSIWCTPQGGSPFQTSGPATVQIPALMNALFTDSMVDNGDGTMTHTAMDGVVTIFNKGWTTVVEDSGTGNLIFTYPDGTVVIVNLGSVTNPGDTVYPAVLTANIALNAGTMRGFTKINDSGGAVINIQLPDPITLGLAANRTHKWTFKRINVYDTGSITLTPDAFKTIDGSPSYVFANNDFTAVTLWTDGVNYWIS